MPSALSHSFLRGARFTPVLVLHVPGMKRRKSFPSPGNWGLRCLPWRWWKGSLSSASLAWSRCQALPQSLWGNRRAEGGPAAGKCTERMGNEGRGEVALPGQRTALTALPLPPGDGSRTLLAQSLDVGLCPALPNKGSHVETPSLNLGRRRPFWQRKKGGCPKRRSRKSGMRCATETGKPGVLSPW